MAQLSPRAQDRPVYPHPSNLESHGVLYIMVQVPPAPLRMAGMFCLQDGVQGGSMTLFAATLLPPLFAKDRGQSTGDRWPAVDNAQNSPWGQAACPRHTPAPFDVEGRSGPLLETWGDQVRGSLYALPRVLLVSMRPHPAPAPTRCQCLNSQRPQRLRRSR